MSWNSEAGTCDGRSSEGRGSTAATKLKGYIVRASKEVAAQYEIASDKTDHVAMHKGSALHKRAARKSRPRIAAEALNGWVMAL